MSRVAWALSLAVGVGCSEEPAWSGTMHAWVGEGGVAVLLDAPAPEGSVLVTTTEDGAVVQLADEPATVVLDGDGAAGACYDLQLAGEVLASACAVSPSLSVELDPQLPVLLADRDIALTMGLALDGAVPPSGDWLVRRSLPSLDQQAWLDPACLDESALDEACWVEEPIPLGEQASVSLPAYRPELEDDRVEHIGLYLRVQDEHGGQVLLGGGQRLVFLEARLFWGDLHAHSNLSMDGCEDVEGGCHARGELPGLDFFDNAVAEGLDFAALTDHAEYDTLLFSDGTELGIWEQTQRLVQDAQQLEEQGFLPLLGYEWTNRAHADLGGEDPEYYEELFSAGHRTVLFEEASACDAYRISAGAREEGFVKAGTDLFYTADVDDTKAESVEQLYELLDQAAVECGEQRWLSWFHHPAYLPPNPVSWSDQENREHAGDDLLVEIASEHGSSECRDVSVEGCGFRVVGEEDDARHLSWGSVQEALTLGYRLGFVGGTDAHDGRPGSLTDGPSHTGRSEPPEDTKYPESPEPNELFCNGSITGVWVRGELTRHRLWGALSERFTMASTVLVDGVAMAAIGADGAVYLPGQEPPGEAFPMTLLLGIEPGADREVSQIEVIDPRDGAVLAQAEAAMAELELEEPGGPAVYVRARLDWQGEEHRLWISPLFLAQD